MGRHNSYNNPEYIKARTGKNNVRWKGGIQKNKEYVYVHCPDHPFANKNYVPKHRLVMEKHIKRFLLPKEIVHHINGNRSDNRIENLQLLNNRGEHYRIHQKKIIKSVIRKNKTRYKDIFNSGREFEKDKIVGIINGKFRKAFPDLAKQLVEEIEKK